MLKTFKLEGTSMWPLFKAGDVALVRPLTAPGSLFPGDCVVYNYEGRNLLHRVIAVENGGPLISDDAGELPLHQVPWRNITGKVITSNPFKKGLGGRIYHKLRRLLTP